MPIYKLTTSRCANVSKFGDEVTDITDQVINITSMLMLLKQGLYCYYTVCSCRHPTLNLGGGTMGVPKRFWGVPG